MTTILGIDEAGKGPIIGSLFIVGALIDEKATSKLKTLGVKDSKLLTHKKRLELEKDIISILKKFKVIEITPEEIDKAVNGHNGLNLNWLEAIKTAELINYLKPDKAIIDCPSPNLKAYEDYLRNHLKHKKVELFLTHKAERFEVVAAASILAKIHREKNVEKIEKLVGESIGSGYPSNPICQKFLKNNYKKYPDIFRKSWATYKNIVKEKSQKGLKDF